MISLLIQVQINGGSQMKKMICFFVVGLSMFLGTAAFAETAPFAGQCIDGKFYVEPGTVHVAPNGIFLNLEGNCVPVNYVAMDEYGVYVLGYDCMRMVTCPRCGRTYNADRYSDRCPHTGEKVQYSS
jgi:hypothetical protein